MINERLPVVHGTGGAPRYADSVRQKILNGLKLGWTRSAAYGRAGVAMSTFYEWMKEDDRSFAEAVVQAEAYAHSTYTTRLGRQAAAGSVKATTFFLERRHPADWGQKIDVTVRARTVEDELDEMEEGKLIELLEHLRRSRSGGIGVEDPSRS